MQRYANKVLFKIMLWVKFANFNEFRWILVVTQSEKVEKQNKIIDTKMLLFSDIHTCMVATYRYVIIAATCANILANNWNN